MKAQLVILVCCIVGVYSQCIPLRAPVGKLPDGCKVRNLTVTVHPSRDIISNTLCNSTADESLFNFVPQYIRFQHLWRNPAPGYLVTAVDLTSKKLIWMLSNLTLSSGSTIFPSFNRYAEEILPFHKPELSQYSRQHVIEFHVFEEFRNLPWRRYIPNNAIYAASFNLSSWIESQQNSGITICGPVAGGSVVAFQQLPTPAPGPGPHRPKGNAANRIVVDGILLAGFFIVFRVLGF